MNDKNGAPLGWLNIKLGEFVESQKGKKPKRTSKEKSETYFLPYVNIQAFEKNLIDEYTDGDGCVLCEDGDFLMVWDGSRSGYVGKAIKGALGSTLVKINFPGIFNDYAFYFLQSKYLEINTRAKGTGTPHVDPSLLWNYIFPIPPLNEQHRIVERLEALFSELDSGVKALRTAQEQLMVYRQAVMKDAFEGKLIKKDDGLEWKWTTLGTFAENIRIGPFGTLLHESDYVANGTPIINPKHIKNQKILHDCMVTVSTEKLKELSSYILKENDIILGRRGEMGRTAYITEREDGWICGTGSMIIRLKKGNLAKVYSLLLSEKRVINYLKNNCTGTTMSNLNEKIVKSIPIPIIPFDEQKIIFDEIETRFSLCDNFEETIEQSLAKAETLRQSILQRAFAGQLVEQDPNDEPACKLLERIRLARENDKVEKEAAKGRTKK